MEKIKRICSKICSEKLKASFTIEAAIIVPITMVIIVTMIFLTFYFHDRITMSAESEIVVLENAGNSDDDTQEINSNLKTLLESKVLMSKEIGVNISREDEEYKVITNGNFVLPIPLMKEMTGGDMQTIQTEINISSLDSRKQLLKYKAVCDGLEGSGVVDFDD